MLLGVLCFSSRVLHVSVFLMYHKGHCWECPPELQSFPFLLFLPASTSPHSPPPPPIWPVPSPPPSSVGHPTGASTSLMALSIVEVLLRPPLPPHVDLLPRLRLCRTGSASPSLTTAMVTTHRGTGGTGMKNQSTFCGSIYCIHP